MDSLNTILFPRYKDVILPI